MVTRPKFAKRRQLNSAVGNYPPSITRSWLEMMLSIPGHTKESALLDLNEELGTTTRLNRLYEWLTGKQQPSRAARKYMTRCCIAAVLRRHGVATLSLTDRQLDAIADELS